MPIGIHNITQTSMKNITDIINISSGNPAELFIRANQIIYQGWFYFIMLFILGIILFVKAQDHKDQPLINAMYICASLSVIAMFLRVVFIITANGDVWSLLTDFQMWIFPLITVVLAGIVRFMSD